MSSKYFGKACAKHPELKGERYRSTSHCLACERSRANAARAADPEGARRKQNARRAANIAGARAKDRALYAANPEAARAKARNDYANHTERRKAKSRAHREANPEYPKQYRAANALRLAEYRRNYLAANLDKHAKNSARRRAYKLNATPSWADSAEIEAFYLTANMLGMHTGEWYHVDHVVPLQSRIVCGLHVEHNLQVLPGKDNLLKGNRHWPDMP